MGAYSLGENLAHLWSFGENLAYADTRSMMSSKSSAVEEIIILSEIQNQ